MLERGCSPSPSLVSRLSSLFSLSFALSLASLSRLSSLACLVSRLSRSLSLAHARTQRASVSTCMSPLSLGFLSLSVSVCLSRCRSLSVCGCVGVGVGVPLSFSRPRRQLQLRRLDQLVARRLQLALFERCSRLLPGFDAAALCAARCARRFAPPRLPPPRPLPRATAAAPLRSAHLSSVVTKVYLSGGSVLVVFFSVAAGFPVYRGIM